jgi:hypothetical protein
MSSLRGTCRIWPRPLLWLAGMHQQHMSAADLPSGRPHTPPACPCVWAIRLNCFSRMQPASTLAQRQSYTHYGNGTATAGSTLNEYQLLTSISWASAQLQHHCSCYTEPTHPRYTAYNTQAAMRHQYRLARHHVSLTAQHAHSNPLGALQHHHHCDSHNPGNLAIQAAHSSENITPAPP